MRQLVRQSALRQPSEQLPRPALAGASGMTTWNKVAAAMKSAARQLCRDRYQGLEVKPTPIKSTTKDADNARCKISLDKDAILAEVRKQHAKKFIGKRLTHPRHAVERDECLFSVIESPRQLLPDLLTAGSRREHPAIFRELKIHERSLPLLPITTGA